MEFANLVGKTIASAEQKQHPNYDDDGFLELTFTDGSKCLIVATYCGYSGHSEFARLVNECGMKYSEACEVLNKHASKPSPASPMTISPLPPESVDLDASWVDTSDPHQGPILRKRNEANTAWVAVIDEVAND